MKFRDFLEYNIHESGNSATSVIWRKDGKNKIGEFSVTSNKSGNISNFYIVISKKEKYKKHNITNIEIYEFKFYDSGGNIELSNNMEFMLGVGPTIKEEFEKLMDTNPEAVFFSADKKEKSRVKYYDRFTQKISQDYDYVPFFKTAINDLDDDYVLVRSDKVEEFKQNFLTSNL